MSSNTVNTRCISLEAFNQNPLSYLQRWNYPVLLLNGVSTSGKTSLALKLIPYGYARVSLDEVCTKILWRNIKQEKPELYRESKANISQSDFIKLYLHYEINSTQYDPKLVALLTQLSEYFNNLTVTVIEKLFADSQIYAKVAKKTDKLLAQGKKVVIDTVISTNQVMAIFDSCMHKYRVLHILLYCPLNTLLRRCKVRNLRAQDENNCDYRLYDQILEQYSQFYTTALEAPVDSDHLREDKAKLNAALEKVMEESLELLTKLYSSDKELRQKKLAAVDKTITSIRQSWILQLSEQVYARPNINYELVFF